VIAIEHVTKLYHQTPALRDVTLHVERGEVLGVLGPNGSGKTTLLRLLTGALSPTVGRLTVAGYDTMRQPMEARRRVGYVPEALPLYPHMRVQWERLRHVADSPPCLHGLSHGVIPSDHELSHGGGERACEQAQQRRLP